MSPSRIIEFPAAWSGSPWLFQPEPTMLRIKGSDDPVFVVGGVLTDGTVLVAMSWPGGTNFARTGPFNSWSLEERTMRPPTATHQRCWKTIVDSHIEALRMAEAAYGGRPC